MRRTDLATLRDVRREMAAVYRAVRCGGLLPEQGTRLVYILQAIARVLQAEQAGRTGDDEEGAEFCSVDEARVLLARLAREAQGEPAHVVPLTVAARPSALAASRD